MDSEDPESNLEINMTTQNEKKPVGNGTNVRRGGGTVLWGWKRGVTPWLAGDQSSV